MASELPTAEDLAFVHGHGSKWERILVRALVLLARGATCPRCSSPATCIGSYEGDGVIEFGCDLCCGHGNEDGWCADIRDYAAVRLPGEESP